jgi:uncharacterized protein
MRLVNEFSVAAPIDVVWSVLTDIPTVVGCVPGAGLDRQEGADVHAHVALKVGPVGMTLTGVATVIEQDDAAHRMVLRGNARDRRGNGGTEANVHLAAREQDGGTAVVVTTELELSGRMAQFGTGVVTQVGNRVIGQFVTRLDAVIRGDGATLADPSAGITTTSDETTRSGVRGTVGTDVGAVAIVALAGMSLGLALGRWADRLSRSCPPR